MLCDTLVPRSRQQQVGCFCPDSILVCSARNMCHVMPAIPPPPPILLLPNTLPPSSEREVRGRERGVERPPSLGSQPLNQTLSHPVNLKQSGFNSSCLSVPALAKTMSAHSAEPQPRRDQSRQAWGCSKGHRRQRHTIKHSFSAFIPCYSFLSTSSSFPPHVSRLIKRCSAPSGCRCQGLVFEGYLWFIGLSLCGFHTAARLCSRCHSWLLRAECIDFLKVDCCFHYY